MSLRDGDFGLPLSCSGRHVRSVPARTSVTASAMAETEVHDAHAPLAVDHDVRRFQVAVQYAALVRRHRGRRTSAARLIERLVLGQPAEAPQRRRQVFAVDELHRQIQLPFAARRCRRRGRYSDATPAALRAPRCATAPDAAASRAIPRRQELQRNGLAQPEVIGAIHLAHAPASDKPDNPIPLIEDRPGGNRPGAASLGTTRTAHLEKGVWFPSDLAMGSQGRVADWPERQHDEARSYNSRACPVVMNGWTWRDRPPLRTCANTF